MRIFFLVVALFLFQSQAVFARSTAQYLDKGFDRGIRLSQKYFDEDVVGFLKKLRGDQAVAVKILHCKPLMAGMYYASGKSIEISGSHIDFIDEHGQKLSSESGCGAIIAVCSVYIFSEYLLDELLPGYHSHTTFASLVLFVMGLALIDCGS